MKKWCRQFGKSCKDSNCQYEHLDEMPETCDAVLEFENTKYFAMCELDKGHKSSHKALNFAWDGEGITKTHNVNRLRGLNLMKNRMKKIEQ